MDWSLFWDAFGAIGTTAGSLITAIAVVVAVVQYKQPLIKKIRITVSTSFPVYEHGLGESCLCISLATQAYVLLLLLISILILEGKTLLLII